MSVETVATITSLVFPAFKDNPFTSLLYCESGLLGIRTLETDDFEQFLVLLGGLAPGEICHVQWTQLIAQNQKNCGRAFRRVRRFRRALVSAKKRGVSIVWTLHNRVPHELRFPALELSVLKILASESDGIHIMNVDTMRAVADLYQLRVEKSFHVPHPSYGKTYGDVVPRSEARRYLGIAQNDHVILFLGHIRDYKGIETLLAAFEIAAEADPRLCLVIAGRVHPSMAYVMKAIGQSTGRIQLVDKRIPDEEIAHFLAAADLLALPYQAVLNSGSVALAATYGVPVLLPDFPHLVAEFESEPWVSFFSRAEGALGLSSSLRGAFPLADGVHEAAFAFAEAYNPKDVSRMFLENLRRISAEYSAGTRQR
jgi:beta-1,4-mannosyltransferase